MLLDSVGGMFAEQGKLSVREYVLLAISFSPYANEVLKLAGNGSRTWNSSDRDQ